MIIQRKYQTSFCRRLLTSVLPCWKLLASPVPSGARSSCRSTATLFLNLSRSKKDKQTKAQKCFLPRVAARTLLKLFFRLRAHEKVRGFWSWPTAPMDGGWLGFVRCSFEEKMEGYFAQVAGIPCDLRLSPETRPVGEDEVRR